MGDIVFGDNQYGKVACRLVRVSHDGQSGRNGLQDITVTTTLAGDFDGPHLHGDNRHLLPTDSHKNAVYALARRHGIGQLEDFGLRLARHLVHDTAPTIRRARIHLQEHPWQRVNATAFRRYSGETRTATITYDGTTAWAVTGIDDLALFQTAGSQFHSFFKDRYTTLPETTDRSYATLIRAQWRHTDLLEGEAWRASYEQSRDSLIDTFCTIRSTSTQQVLHALGRRLLESCPSLAEVRLHMPNLHHPAADLTPFGLDNPGEILIPIDRPHGLMEGTVLRENAPAPGLSWW
ncbi:factor-independent urate hydroxylase [Streptomyces sp. NPDC127069]|uniref:factor-independent urate hydroxylase n=1 Tax=Streptomyces sp. NPDC127069 TaxID=3347128 RepID=UPI0036495A69